MLVHMSRFLSAAGHTNGSARRSSCARLSPRNCRVPSYDALKKLRMKLREALVSEVGRKGRSMNGMSTAVQVSTGYLGGHVFFWVYLSISSLVCRHVRALESLLGPHLCGTMNPPIVGVMQQVRCWRLLSILIWKHLSI